MIACESRVTYRCNCINLFINESSNPVECERDGISLFFFNYLNYLDNVYCNPNIKKKNDEHKYHLKEITEKKCVCMYW